MCGILGVVHPRNISAEKLLDALATIAHRGPDDQGVAVAYSSNLPKIFSTPSSNLETKGIYPNFDQNALNYDVECIFGHVRLSIIDLTVNGHQPMRSSDGRFILTFNGEIYNFIELRSELMELGWSFNTQSDTEVVLIAYLQWGNDSFAKLRGMWAIGIFDTRDKTLILSRDRYGIKPLFYIFDGDKDILFFSSEIKALRSLYGRLSISRESIVNYSFYGFTDLDESTFFSEVKQLEVGCFLEFKNDSAIINKYYSCDEILEEKNDTFYIDGINETLRYAIGIHLRSDVPVGMCLSGGLDSNLIAGIIKNDFTISPKTFTAILGNDPNDESSLVDLNTKALQLENYKTLIDFDSFVSEIGDVLSFHDEPFFTISPYLQYKVFELAKNNGIKVMLDGQGADEIFAGYYSAFPFFLLELLKSFELKRFSGEYKKLGAFEKKLQKTLINVLLPNRLKFAIRKRINSKWFSSDAMNLIDNRLIETAFNHKNLNSRLKFELAALRTLLRFEDRASMAHSIESRVPYLDHILVQEAFQIKGQSKIDNGYSKIPIRNIAPKYMHESIYGTKRKIGFAGPEKLWEKKIEKHDEFQSIVRDAANLKQLKLIDTNKKLSYYNSIEVFLLEKWLEKLK